MMMMMMMMMMHELQVAMQEINAMQFAGALLDRLLL